ncbi:MAG: helix-turn-helix domain-containing protein [Bdellovibrionales bacterium]|nr:helix-turn-helix domain-containing protein [Bdellovibrionales bacterium]
MRKKKSGAFDASESLKMIFDSLGLTRQHLAQELGVTRDAIQRMIRGGFVPLHHLAKLKALSTSDFDCDVEPETLRATNFRLKKNSVLEAAKEDEIRLAGLEKAPDREQAYRDAMRMRADLKRFNDLQLKHELELRGWLVQEPTDGLSASK